MKGKKIILVGNPNTGKSTLFNTLTNSNEKVSNWHGVTVGVKSKAIFNNERLNADVIDTPGLYSLSAYSNEEKITVNYLNDHKEDLIINVCDANNLKRNLVLTLELLKNGYNIILAVNMSKEVKGVDYHKLSKLLSVNIVEIDARNQKGVLELVDCVIKYQNQKTQKINKINKIMPYSIDLNKIFAEISQNKEKDCCNKTDKIDRVVLNKIVFIFIFITSLFLIFYITFGPIGALFSSIINNIFSKIIDYLRKIILCTNISYIIKMLIIDGVFSAIVSVISFLPQIILLMFFISVLEDIGFMSRVAFMFDGVLKKVGLSGKSLFSLMMGFGCTTSAVITTRNLENKHLRKRTVLLLPFISCSAKLPIFLVLSSLFFEKYKYIFVFGLYIFSLLISILFLIIYKKIVPNIEENFILEMPKYRMINIKKIGKDVLSVVKEFLFKVGTLILFFSVIVWFLQNFSIEFKFLSGKNFEKSILYFLCNKISFLFKPLGFESVGIIVSLFLGVVAKEMVVVGLAMMNGVSGDLVLLSNSLTNSSSICYFSKISSIVFLIFILLYSPCISAIFTIKNELGKKTALYVFVSQFLIAYGVSFLVSQLLIRLNFLFVILLFFVLDIFVVLMLRFKKNKTCWGNCNECRRI